jgi:hypothetical protein
MKSPEEIIRTKTFDSLTHEEKLAIQDLASTPLEFDSIQSFLLQLEQFPATELPSVSESVKTSLDQVFKTKHPGIVIQKMAPTLEKTNQKSIALYNRTWFRVAALILLSFGITPYFILKSPKIQPEKTSSTNATQKEVKYHSPIEIKSKKQLIAQNQKADYSQPLTKKVTVHPIDSDTDSYSLTNFSDQTNRLRQAAPYISLKNEQTFLEKDNMELPQSTANMNEGLRADLFPNINNDATNAAFSTPVPANLFLPLLTPAF